MQAGAAPKEPPPSWQSSSLGRYWSLSVSTGFIIRPFPVTPIDLLSHGRSTAHPVVGAAWVCR